MTPARFAIAVGATPQWVRNAGAVLERDFRRAADEACRLGLARQIHEELGVTLERGWRIAGRALARGGEASFRNPDGIARLVIDVDRYRSDFAARLSRARTQHEEGRRGRPPKSQAGSAVERARRYGLDIGLLRDSLRLSPADRLRRLDASRDSVLALRGASRA